MLRIEPRLSKLKLICLLLEMLHGVLKSCPFRIKELILSTFYSCCLQQQFKHGVSYIRCTIRSRHHFLTTLLTCQRIEIRDHKVKPPQFLLRAHNIWQTYTGIWEEEARLRTWAKLSSPGMWCSACCSWIRVNSLQQMHSEVFHCVTWSAIRLLQSMNFKVPFRLL